MEAYHIDRFGSVDGIVLRSSDDLRPGPKEILMRVRASSLNYRDLMVLKGGGRGPTKLGVVPLSDGAGEVAAIGDGVTRVKIGGRVAGCFHPRWFGGPIKPDYLTTGWAPIWTGCWQNTRPSTRRRLSLCQATCPSRKPPPCPVPR
jgi:NADPH:quinone reductase-like Zn-dependent oxidoreductase